MPRLARWGLIAVGTALVILAIIAGAGSRTETLRQLVIDTLADRLDSDVELASFSVDTFPTVDIRGTGLVVRLRGARDGPPLISIRSFTITGGIAGLVSRPRRFRTVTLEGLEINIPPGGADFKVRNGRASNSPPDRPSSPPLRIARLQSTDALLRLIPGRPGKTPREFELHSLEMDGVGADARMPFRATLTNPLPRGFIETKGHFGPWSAKDPAATPVEGTYLFDKADLSTIDGIGGILTSRGEFSGLLGRIDVKGQTDTPDFHLDLTGRPLPLTTTFHAVVDGTDGDTYLKAVNAHLGQSVILASGAVTGTPGVKGRTVRLAVKVEDGRIEDFLRLSVKSSRPLLTGAIALHTDFLLPPGREDVVDKLRLDGAFDLSSAKFASREVQSKLSEMSARASGADKDEPEAVVSDLEGRFRLANASIALSDLQFQIPGASVHLAGTYGLRSEALEFDGTLRMKATISEAAGDGMKSVFLKMVDPLFRKKGAGTVLPIKVRGTREDPKFGLDVMKALTPK